MYKVGDNISNHKRLAEGKPLRSPKKKRKASKNDHDADDMKKSKKKGGGMPKEIAAREGFGNQVGKKKGKKKKAGKRGSVNC